MGIPTSIYGMEVGQSFQRDRLLRIDPFVPGFTASTDRRTEARGGIPSVVGLSKSLLVGFGGGVFVNKISPGTAKEFCICMERCKF